MYLNNERIGLALVPAISNVLYFVDLNQPNLLRHVPEASRYVYAKQPLAGARAIGLVSMRDLVNYISMTLLYRERWYNDAQMTALMTRVKRGHCI